MTIEERIGGPSQQMEVRADHVHVGDLAWLPNGLFRDGKFVEEWVFVENLSIEGDDIVFNGGTTTSIGNPVVVSRRVR